MKSKDLLLNTLVEYMKILCVESQPALGNKLNFSRVDHFIRVPSWVIILKDETFFRTPFLFFRKIYQNMYGWGGENSKIVHTDTEFIKAKLLCNFKNIQ